MRLIDADKLFEFVMSEEGAEILRHSTNMTLRVKDIIERQPTIEAEPVRHGRWLTWEEVFYGDKRASNNLGVFCSMCDKHSDNMTNYCPECGAEMDGGDEDGEC